MDAFWIINLLENDLVSKNYLNLQKNYLSATQCGFDNLLYEDIIFGDNTASNANIEERLNQFIENYVQPLPRRWSFFQNLNDVSSDRLKIFIIGDIDELQTRQFFHLLPTKIRDCQRGLRALPLSGIEIYGLLSYNYNANHTFSDDQVLFMTQLNMLMVSEIKSLIPFEGVYFFQKPAHSIETHYDRISQFLLASILNASHLDSDSLYHAAGSSGLYFENYVQSHNEASLLSAIMFNAFKFNSSDDYLNSGNAEARIRESPLIKNNLLGYEYLADALKENVLQPELDNVEQEPLMNPVKKMFDSSIITNYYYGYIPRLIQNIVNHAASVTVHTYQKFQLTLQQNKLKLLNGSDRNIGFRNQFADLAFSIFKEADPNCSLEQQKELISALKSKVKQGFDELNQVVATTGIEINPFSIPEKYKHAYDLARQDKLNEKQVLTDLESNLKSHPVISAKFIRSVLLGLTFIITVGPVLALMIEHRLIDIGPADIVKYTLWVFSLFIPVIIAYRQIRGLTRRIRLFRDQYIACILAQINNKGQKDLINSISELYAEMLVQCDILENRRQRAAKDLVPLDFKEYSFIPNNLLQPLWVAQKPETSDSGIQFNYGNSGKFNGETVMRSFPGNSIFENMSRVAFADLLEDNVLMLQLIRQLMQESATAKLNARTEFIHKNSVNAILLLDISISMSDQMPDGKAKVDHLREAVKQIKSEETHWVAFSSDIYKDAHGNTIFLKDDAIPDPIGGTELLKGFQHLYNNRLLGFEKIILVSDGLPFSPDAALKAGKDIGIPIDVIYIGTDNGGEYFMQALADQTGGKMVVANDVNLTENLNKAFTIEISGAYKDYKFWELLKLGYYPECAVIAQEFAKKKLNREIFSASFLLNVHAEGSGVEEWVNSARPTCDIRPGYSLEQIKRYYAGDSELSNQEILNILDANYLETKDPVVVSMLQIRDLPSLSHMILDFDAQKEKDIYMGSRVQNNEVTKMCLEFLNGAKKVGVYSELN